MYEDKSLLKSKKVGVQFMGLMSILISQYIAVRYGIDPTITQSFIAALVLGHTGTQGVIDNKLAGQSPVLTVDGAQFVQDSLPAEKTPSPAPTPAAAIAPSKTATPDQVTP